MNLATKHLRCTKCHNVFDNIKSNLQSGVYVGLYEIKCAQCGCKWLVCPLHDLRWCRRRYYLAQEHVKSHHNVTNSVDSNYINSNKRKYSDESECNNYNGHDSDIDTAAAHVDDNDSKSEIINEESAVFKFIQCHKDVTLNNYCVKVQRYLQCESSRVGDGIKRIIACAFAMNQNSDFDSTTWNEIKFHMATTMFCCALSSSQQIQFGNICQMILNNCTGSNNHNDNFRMSHIPVSSIDIDRYYLKRSTSIAQNVPIPSIIELDNHACVSVIEVIQHILYFDIPIDGMLTDMVNKDYKNIISSSSLISNTEISSIIRDQVKRELNSQSLVPLIIPVILWSDDFEPNHVKQHKKSTWIKTITIAPPPDCQTSSKHTYVIALGSKDMNHENVNKYFSRELKQLESPTFMYCKSTNSNIPVVVKILAVSADRPERCALNCMLGHGGITSRRWRYSAYVNQTKLRSCKKCFTQRVRSMDETSFDLCSLCYDWNYNHPSMFVPKPPDYPISQHPNSPPPPKGRAVLDVINLRPIELSYELLIDGVKFCFFNCYHGIWTKLSAMTYLKSIGVNETYGEQHVYRRARSCRNDLSINDSTIYDHLMFPIHWTSGITLDQCIDTPMHQIFQGVVKSIMEKTNEWLSSHYKAFGDHVNPTLIQMHDLGIDWLRIERFMRGRNYTLGGWQAEQFVAFSRIICVIYGTIQDIVRDDELGLNEHECMIQALWCMIMRLMTNTNDHELLVINYVKIFLSACDMFERKAYLMNDDDAMWFSKGNFLSLLNLPSQIAKFGSLRMYWEGSRERSIQQIKPFLTNIRQTSSYYKTKLTYMYVNETLDTINNEILEHLPHTSQYNMHREYEKYSAFKTYSSSDDISLMASSGKVISVLYLSLNSKANKFYVCQRALSPRTCMLHEISFQDNFGFNKCGIWYAPIRLIPVVAEGYSFSQRDVNSMADDYGILCPCISKSETLRLAYTVICQSWKYRSRHNELIHPSLSTNLFCSTIQDNDNV